MNDKLKELRKLAQKKGKGESPLKEVKKDNKEETVPVTINKVPDGALEAIKNTGMTIRKFTERAVRERLGKTQTKRYNGTKSTGMRNWSKELSDEIDKKEVIKSGFIVWCMMEELIERGLWER